jgi:hypothetical protein
MDVRNVLDDGYTIEGESIGRPIIVEAIRKYPAYFYAGSIGPAGFPDTVCGAVQIPDSVAVWVSHILDKAWRSVVEPAEEKLQSPGPTVSRCVAGDVWFHTPANECRGYGRTS